MNKTIKTAIEESISMNKIVRITADVSAVIVEIKKMGYDVDYNSISDIDGIPFDDVFAWEHDNEEETMIIRIYVY